MNHQSLFSPSKPRHRLPIALLTAGIILLLLGLISLLHAPLFSSDCMGVRLLSESALDRITADRESTFMDAPIFLDGTEVPLDRTTRTLYIPQSIGEDTVPEDLRGILSSNEEYSLYFSPDPAFENLSNAIAENHPFTLLVCNDTAYEKYRVIFTTLPVLSLHPTASHPDEEEPQTQVFTGELTAFMAEGKDADYLHRIAYAQWHIRGNSSAVRPKKSWRLSVKDQNGEKKNLSLAGLGKDDDWILNPLSQDDLKIREHLIGKLWNRMQQDADPSLSMSEGAYVELVLNGEYYGLYLLQRRVDRKFLSLNENDILMKGLNYNTPPSIQYAFEVAHSPAGECDAYAIAQSYFQTYAPHTIDLANYADLELLTNLCYLADNVKFKNIYYLWQAQGNNYTLFFIPWDTDFSFGFDYNVGITFNTALLEDARILHRQDYPALIAYDPDLDRKIALRWQELRKSYLCDEYIIELACNLRSELQQSGALSRDYAKWGDYTWGFDTEEVFYTFIRTRIGQLDEYYGSILGKE